MSFSSEPGYQRWRGRPARASTANKNDAISWMESLPSLSHGPCIVDASLETLRLAKYARCNDKSKQMMLLYNEPPSCGQMSGESAEAEVAVAVETITSANTERLKINVIYIPEFAIESRLGFAFGQSLAGANNGRFESFLP